MRGIESVKEWILIILSVMRVTIFSHMTIKRVHSSCSIFKHGKQRIRCELTSWERLLSKLKQSLRRNVVRVSLEHDLMRLMLHSLAVIEELLGDSESVLRLQVSVG